MKRLVLITLFIFGLVSCTERDHSPEGTLTEFIDARVGKVVNRDFVMERVTGKMKENLEEMNDEDFAKFSDLRNTKRSSFKILSKSCQEDKCFLTYSLGYNTNDEFATEVKK